VTTDEVLGMIIAGTCPPAAIPGPGAVTAVVKA
jgi:D-xylose transport system ATP-binding protein